MKLWLGYFESANYAGFGEYCIAKAKTEDEARSVISAYAEDYYYEQDSDQWFEENEVCENDESWAEVVRVVEFDESHELWGYYKNPGQSSFYPEIN